MSCFIPNSHQNLRCLTSGVDYFRFIGNGTAEELLTPLLRQLNIDDLIAFNNKKFGNYVKEIYLSQLTVEKANTSDDVANYLDLTFIIESNNRLYTKLYDKRDDFDFHIVNFPFLSSNIPSSPSYGVYISQLIRYARCCSYYDDLEYHHKRLVDRLLSQGYEVKHLRNSFKNFMADIQIS